MKKTNPYLKIVTRILAYSGLWFAGGYMLIVGATVWLWAIILNLILPK
ncbi:hypothetical protein QUF63_00760 [Anaerolineales bacterium HSG25]|nr:hypothetical protein [Anaerolineales bacterium HSG25]